MNDLIQYRRIGLAEQQEYDEIVLKDLTDLNN